MTDGTVNGLENIKDLRESGELPTCTQISVVNMVPLCQQSIYYASFAFPIGKLFKAEDLSEMFRTLKRDCEEEGISKVSIAGDGDPRMRSFQKQTYCYVSSEFKWLEKLDFPIRYGRSIAGTDFPVSDILHVLKKLRNNNQYLSTRVLLFAYPRDISVANRLKFSARWECVVELWHSDADEKFRDAISKSSVALTDKQDPSLATVLFLLYPLFYEAGFNGAHLILCLLR